MRHSFASIVLFGLLALSAAVPRAYADEDRPAGKVMVWDGYLFQDEEGRIRLGWPVIAMGVMDMPAHVVEGDVTTRLGPLLTEVKDDYVFWNYDLEARGDGALAGIPRVLVRMRGRVTLERPKDPQWGSYRGGARTMHDARLVSVEFLPEAWLRRWGRIFRDLDSPFRIDLDRGKITDAELRGFAKKAMTVLHSMRAARSPTEAERKRAKAIDPQAQVVTTHRRRSEGDLQRWLMDMTAKHEGLALEGIDELPPLPPTSVELQRLFLESETKKAFLDEVRKLWRGELDLLRLPCYVEEEGSTIWTQVDLGHIESSWSDVVFSARRATTQRMVGR